MPVGNWRKRDRKIVEHTGVAPPYPRQSDTSTESWSSIDANQVDGSPASQEVKDGVRERVGVRVRKRVGGVSARVRVRERVGVSE